MATTQRILVNNGLGGGRDEPSNPNHRDRGPSQTHRNPPGRRVTISDL